MMNQKEAVFQVVKSVVEINGKVELTGSEKERVYRDLFTLFRSGQVALSGSRSDEWLIKYIPGLVNNWLRKDERLNGGERYVTKNPGSRAGSGDEQLKALKALLAVTTDPSARVEIQRAIDKRIEELKPKTEINISALPEHLRHLVPGA